MMDGINKMRETFKKSNKTIEIYSRTGKLMMKQVVMKLPAFKNGFSRGKYGNVSEGCGKKNKNEKKQRKKG